jgi:hypothetical protein
VICRTEGDAERFAEQDGHCGVALTARGEPLYCSPSCRENGRHVAVGNDGTVFARGQAARLQGGTTS